MQYIPNSHSISKLLHKPLIVIHLQEKKLSHLATNNKETTNNTKNGHSLQTVHLIMLMIFSRKEECQDTKACTVKKMNERHGLYKIICEKTKWQKPSGKPCFVRKHCILISIS